jgi:hypothetical protein
MAHGELGIIGQHTAHASEHGASSCAQSVDIAARIHARDPLALPVGKCGASVERGAHFQLYKGASKRHAGSEFAQFYAAGCLAHAHVYLNASSS